LGVVLEGSVQIVKDDFYGNRSILTYAEPGELFGEAFACGDVEKMPVSGYATKVSKILMLSCKKMLTVCSSACSFHNRLIKNLLTVVANRNLNLSQKISVMSHKTTKEKLIAYLSEEAKRQNSSEFSIPFNRQQLADFLSVDRSAMSNELCKMRDEGLLEFERSAFKLL
jgi:CRP-like cAMP-binding protein